MSVFTRPLRIAARQSDLARLQARAVGQALRDKFPGLKIEFQFRESLGDKNLEDPLWKMPERGVFTEDFAADLRDGACDMVVHSWKDLPTEERPNSLIAATLPRADARDLLFVRRDRWDAALQRGELRIFSSSPRRAYNLLPFLNTALPARFQKIEFLSVRGNIPTRLRKMLAADAAADGIVVAKAALDRLWTAPDQSWGDDFSKARAAIAESVAQCRWMVLPLRENPTAAAQGALAIEIARGRDDLMELLAAINCESTFRAVVREREILSAYGGGCHQKIGVACIPVAGAWAISLRGLTDKGETLDRWNTERRHPVIHRERVGRAYAWPLQEQALFERETLSLAPPAHRAWSVAKAYALPQAWDLVESKRERVLWVAGSTTWKSLASRGWWVNGSSEGLGERVPELPWLNSLAWAKLSHDGAPTEGAQQVFATYRLRPKSDEAWAELANKQHFFWASGSLFTEALRRFPALCEARHSCGPGHTRLTIRSALGRDPEIFLSHQEWLDSTVEKG